MFGFVWVCLITLTMTCGQNDARPISCGFDTPRSFFPPLPITAALLIYFISTACDSLGPLHTVKLKSLGPQLSSVYTIGINAACVHTRLTSHSWTGVNCGCIAGATGDARVPEANSFWMLLAPSANSRLFDNHGCHERLHKLNAWVSLMLFKYSGRKRTVSKLNSGTKGHCGLRLRRIEKTRSIFL